MKFVGIFVLLSIFSISIPSSVIAQNSELPQFGLEFEYASENRIEADASKIPDELYIKPLRIVRSVLNDVTGAIQIQPWSKSQRLGARVAVYNDAQNRRWQVMPESVNTTGYDGFEFVTPPLRSEMDLDTLEKIIHDIEKTGDYTHGVRSSVHVTVDISDLIDPSGNANRLVDTILFIENHWPEIYSAISPTRYGTIVNRFSIPLATEQKGLLNALSRLPPEERSFERVRSLFEDYHDLELRLRRGDKVRAWKYRSANYKKLFGLGDEKMIPVIEFRILDLRSVAELRPQIELLRKVVAKGHIVGASDHFRDSFSDINVRNGLSDINQAIYESDPVRYVQFLSNLGLSPQLYPKMGYLRGPPSNSLPKRERQRLLASIDTSRRLEFEGTPITFGFEAESWGKSLSRIVSGQSEETYRVRVEDYPFLDGTVDQEDTGNVEVRSIPFDTLDETIKNMRTLSEALNIVDVAYHLHIRVPKKMTDLIPESELSGWFSRISDAVYLWRTQNKNHYLALRTLTQKRRPPHALDEKGSITVRQIGKSIDIELRGFMSDVDQIEHFSKMILVGLFQPELIQGFTDFQSLLHVQSENLIETMRKHFQKYKQRDLTPEEVDLLRDMSTNATRDGILPLFNYENAPYLSDLARIKIRDATFEFKKRLSYIMEEVLEGKLYGRQSNELYKQFRLQVKLWAQTVDLYSLIEPSILNRPIDTYYLLKNPEFIQKVLEVASTAAVDPSISEAAKRLLSRLPEDELFIKINALLASQQVKHRKIATTLLTELVLESSDFNKRNRAAALLKRVIDRAVKSSSAVVDCAEIFGVSS